MDQYSRANCRKQIATDQGSDVDELVFRAKDYCLVENKYIRQKNQDDETAHGNNLHLVAIFGRYDSAEADKGCKEHKSGEQ